VSDLELRLHPLAADEAQKARNWYRERSPVAAGEFLRELDAAMLAISEAPSRWPRVYEKYRRYLMHKFPFSVVYIHRSEFAEVLAVAHHRRRPGYWKNR
jgi:plasmid stabilization system protein ParE